MKEMSDEELQQWLENKQQLPAEKVAGKDANAYRALFEALGEDPSKGLPYDFSAKVAKHIRTNEKRSNELKYNLAAVSIFIAALAVIYGALVFFTPDEAPLLLKYKWILLLFPLSFIAIQYFDQRLVKAGMFKSSYKR